MAQKKDDTTTKSTKKPRPLGPDGKPLPRLRHRKADRTMGWPVHLHASKGFKREFKARIKAPSMSSGPSPYDDRDVRTGHAPEELGEEEWVARKERKP